MDGALADQVAHYLSHTSPATTKRHYVAEGAAEVAQQERVLQVLQGGRR